MSGQGIYLRATFSYRTGCLTLWGKGVPHRNYCWSEGGFPLFSGRSAGFPALPSRLNQRSGRLPTWCVCGGGPLPEGSTVLTVCATQASISTSSSSGGDPRLGRMVVIDDLQAGAPTAAGL